LVVELHSSSSLFKDKPTEEKERKKKERGSFFSFDGK